MSITINREMTITHADFFRVLPKALQDYEFTVAGSEVHVKLANNSYVNIRLSEETRRKAGAFSLPVTRLEVRFEGMAEQSVREFLISFDRAYQKGGG